MSNPMGMMDMVKGQAYFALTQMGMMQFSEMFFSGFVLSESTPRGEKGAGRGGACWEDADRQ
jgi:hypothetical protein